MTKLLEQAIAKVRELSEAEQDDAAEMMLDLVAKHAGPAPLDAQTRAAIAEGSDQARRGEFASDEEIDALFNRDQG